MLGCDNIASIGLYDVKTMELIQLRKIEKSSESDQSKETYLSSCWFISKTRKGVNPTTTKRRQLIMCILNASVFLH